MRPFRLMCLAAFAIVFAIAAMACGSSSGSARGGVTIESVTSSTADGLIGGKPADPPASGSPAGDPRGTTTDASAPAATDEPAATETPAVPLTSDGSAAPTEGRWIDVDVTKFVVRLMDGDSVTREISPVAVGEQVDTGEYASTQTGLFQVYNKVEDLAYDPPYDTYINDWVGFDPDKANGFHSFLKDESGKVVDARTGRISNGCIRTGAPDAIYAFAEVGMPVYVHH